MTPEEIQKLLGGYATGTLTPAEQQALFNAALHDQQLFDALAKEQPLHDLLRDPAARAHLLASLDREIRPRWRMTAGWMLAGGALAACLAVAVLYLRPAKPVAHPVLVAETKVEPALPTPAPVAPPSASPAEPVYRKPAPVHRPAAAVPAPKQLDETAAPKIPLSATPAPVAEPVAAPSSAKAALGAIVTTRDMAANSSASQPAQNARSLFYGGGAVSGFLPSERRAQSQLAMPAGSAGAMAPVPNLGVKWTALRKDADGLFTEVDPEQIKAGDTIKLRLVPNDNGFITVQEGKKPLIARQAVQRLQPIETPELTHGVGEVDLTVTLTRQPQQAANLVRAASTDQVSLRDNTEHAVYEVKTGANFAAPVLVRIPLQFQ